MQSLDGSSGPTRQEQEKKRGASRPLVSLGGDGGESNAPSESLHPVPSTGIDRFLFSPDATLTDNGASGQPVFLPAFTGVRAGVLRLCVAPFRALEETRAGRRSL